MQCTLCVYEYRILLKVHWVSCFLACYVYFLQSLSTIWCMYSSASPLSDEKVYIPVILALGVYGNAVFRAGGNGALFALCTVLLVSVTAVHRWWWFGWRTVFEGTLHNENQQRTVSLRRDRRPFQWLTVLNAELDCQHFSLCYALNDRCWWLTLQVQISQLSSSAIKKTHAVLSMDDGFCSQGHSHFELLKFRHLIHRDKTPCWQCIDWSWKGVNLILAGFVFIATVLQTSCWDRTFVTVNFKCVWWCLVSAVLERIRTGDDLCIKCT